MTLTVPGRLVAPAPGWTTSADVIVVGSGIAGLTAALRLRQRVDRVLLVTKTVLDEGSTAWAQGGIAAALDPADSPQEHLHDTLVAGRRASATSRRCAASSPRAPRRVRELVALGTEFDRGPDGRDLADPRGRPPPRPDRPRRRRRDRAGDLPGADRRAARGPGRPGHRGPRARPRRRPAAGRRPPGLRGDPARHRRGPGRRGRRRPRPRGRARDRRPRARSTPRRPTRPWPPATASRLRCAPGRSSPTSSSSSSTRPCCGSARAPAASSR